MAWNQVKPFDLGKAGTQKYLCLKNVRLGYGIGSKWEYAHQDWDNNIGKHGDQSFPGVAVPVYFDWTGTVDGVRKNWGHVAVRLPDGRIWTDGKYYGNVNDVASQYLGSTGKYLGWGESVNGVRVVEFAPDPAPAPDPRDQRIKELEAALAAERNKPPVVKEVVKEVPVEKIVEKVVTKEIIKEVPRIVELTYYSTSDLFRALIQKAVEWFKKKG